MSDVWFGFAQTLVSTDGIGAMYTAGEVIRREVSEPSSFGNLPRIKSVSTGSLS